MVAQLYNIDPWTTSEALCARLMLMSKMYPSVVSSLAPATTPVQAPAPAPSWALGLAGNKDVMEVPIQKKTKLINLFLSTSDSSWWSWNSSKYYSTFLFKVRFLSKILTGAALEGPRKCHNHHHHQYHEKKTIVLLAMLNELNGIHSLAIELWPS